MALGKAHCVANTRLCDALAAHFFKWLLQPHPFKFHLYLFFWRSYSTAGQIYRCQLTMVGMLGPWPLCLHQWIASLILSPDEVLRDKACYPKPQCRVTDSLLFRVNGTAAWMAQTGNSLSVLNVTHMTFVYMRSQHTMSMHVHRGTVAVCMAVNFPHHKTLATNYRKIIIQHMKEQIHFFACFNIS